MQRILLILAFIILSRHCLSYATETLATPSTHNAKEPYKEGKNKSDITPAEANTATIADNFAIDKNWIAVELGAFEPHAINNSTQIAGDIISDKGGPFAGVWKQGFVEKLDGTLVTLRSSAAAINDSGQIVGYQKGRYGNNYERAVLWNNGEMQELGTLSGVESRALAINNSGDVVGWVKTDYGARDAFLWRSGTMEYLVALTSGIAINTDGQILGTIDGGNPVLWNKGIMQKLEPPGDQEFTPLGAKQELNGKTAHADQTDIVPNRSESSTDRLVPTCLNEAGQVAGYISICGLYSPRTAALSKLTALSGAPGCFAKDAFTWNNGELQHLDTKENERFVPLGMNKYGMLSGKINNRAAVWHKGNVTELNAYFKGLRGWKSTEARGINDYGQIIVYATNGTPSESKAFLVTPKSGVPILIKGTKYAEVEQEPSKTPKVLRRQSRDK